MIYAVNTIHPQGNGYCIVSANSPKQAEDIIHAQSRWADAKVVDFKKLCWQDTDTHIIYEGAITTLGRNAYELAVQNGFKGSIEDWLKSLKGAKGDALQYEDWDIKSKEAVKKEIINDLNLNVDFASIKDVDKLFNI